MTGALEGFTSLFGGSEQSSETRDIAAPEFRTLRQPFADVLRDLLAAPPEPTARAFSVLPGEAETLARLRALGTTAGRAAEINPFLRAAIDAAVAPFRREQEEFLTRQLPSAFTRAGQQLGPGGSSAATRFGAIGSADIAGRAAEAAGARALEAVRIGQAEIETTVNNLKAQALPRLIQVLGIETGLKEFQTRIQALIQLLGIVGDATSVVPGQFSTRTETSGILGPSGGLPFFRSAASGIAGALGLDQSDDTGRA